MHDGFALGTTYQNGPVFLTSNFYRPSDSDKSFVFNIGSTYTFHDVRFSGGFQTSKLKNIHSILDGDYEDIIDCDVAQKTFLLGLQVPYQNYTFNASYNKAYVKNITVHEKRYDGHLDKVALGAVYALSKRTSIYAITTYVKSDNGTIYSFHNDTGSTSTHSHGYQLGITHLF